MNQYTLSNQLKFHSFLIIIMDEFINKKNAAISRDIMVLWLFDKHQA